MSDSKDTADSNNNKNNGTNDNTANNDKPDEIERRYFIEKVTGVVAGAGVCATAWPFVASMNPSTDVLAKATTEVDLNEIVPGQTKTYAWQGKPVFILHRTDTQIQEVQNSQGGKQPQEDANRVLKPQWLVVVGLCTHLGCVPTRNNDGWFCPCHGSLYDNSGRILSGPAPANLELPPYKFLSDDKIVIGKV